MDRGAWWATVHEIAESDATVHASTFHFYPQEVSVQLHWGGAQMSEALVSSLGEPSLQPGLRTPAFWLPAGLGSLAWGLNVLRSQAALGESPLPTGVYQSHQQLFQKC